MQYCKEPRKSELAPQSFRVPAPPLTSRLACEVGQAGSKHFRRCYELAWGIVSRAPSMLRGRGELVKKKQFPEFRQRGLNIEEASPNNDPVSRVNISDEY